MIWQGGPIDHLNLNIICPVLVYINSTSNTMRFFLIQKLHISEHFLFRRFDFSVSGLKIS